MKLGNAKKKLPLSFAVGVVLAFIGAQVAMAESLTVVGWGGALSKAESEAFDKPFTSNDGRRNRTRSLQWRSCPS